jgi:cellulose synthase/poly-beta-1,6-N-acetylglucosamine synthase-like glycosyltransferase
MSDRTATPTALTGELDAEEIRVTVVITTTGRRELERSLRSVLAQTRAAHEVLVIDDRPGEATGSVLSQLRPNVRVLRTGGVGGSRARNTGIQEADGDVVALLDDDDIWFPWKLERQLRWLANASDPGRTVVGCQAFVEPASGVYPRRCTKRGSVGEFLFCRRLRSLRYDGFVQTSGLVFSVALGRLLPFEPNLRSHQDWDWLVRAERIGAELLIVPEELYVYCTPGANSVTRSARLESEQEWATQIFAREPRVLFGYMLTFASPRAVASGRGSVALSALRQGFRLGSFDLGSFLAGMGYLGLELFRLLRRSVYGRAGSPARLRVSLRRPRSGAGSADEGLFTDRLNADL